MPNFSIALTGLQADSIALNTIGNNLANLNTTAFKKQTTTFEDLFYQNIGTTGSSETLQVGVGTRVSGTASNFTQGSLTTTNKATDLALNGNGFFVVQRQGVQALTRAGDFQTDSTGNLISASGENVMGYAVQGGVANINSGLMPIQIPLDATEPAQATSNISLTTSLDASAATGAVFSSPVKLYDSLGTLHQGTMTYTKTSASTWSYGLALPAGDATGTPVNNTGTLTFDSNGNLVTPAANLSGVTFPGMKDGASDLSLNLNLYGSAGSPLVTQTAGTSTTSATSQDGYAAGSYQSFAVDGTGLITAQFSNGHTAAVGQVAVANVANVDGLVRVGGNDYGATLSSGDLVSGVANAGGRGAIEGESLESSNVDISAEFSDLIIAQRAFEANSKTVTTFDQVTETAIGMLR